ncbi:MAG: glutaredoxin 3 [Phenylobacterium sp.]
MAAVTIYTKPFCPYCDRALSLLERKGAQVTEIKAAFDPALRREMLMKSGGASTYPQIFVGGQHVGGCDDLHDLEAQGRLDALLAG